MEVEDCIDVYIYTFHIKVSNYILGSVYTFEKLIGGNFTNHSGYRKLSEPLGRACNIA